MHIDGTAALRTVGQRQAVDARGIAQEVARESGAIRVAVGEHPRAGREVTLGAGGTGAAGIDAQVLALAEDGYCRSLVGPHQRRLLQEFGQVTVESGVPSHDALQRQGIDLATLHQRIAGRAGGA